MKQHENLESILYQFQLKLTERWINNDKDSLEEFMAKFLNKNGVKPSCEHLKKDYIVTLRKFHKLGLITDGIYSELLEFYRKM